MQQPSKWEKFRNYITNLIYPRNIKCIFCDDELNKDAVNSTCVNCLRILPFIHNACPRCGNRVDAENLGVCIDCKSNNYYFSNAISVFTYEDDIKFLVQNYKYNHLKYLADPISDYMAQRFATSHIFVDLVTYIPMFKEKEKKRGFNHAKLLAKKISEKIDIPLKDLVQKVKQTPTQTALSISERKANVVDSFALMQNIKKTIKDKSILIIDDVFTTGATSNEVCKMLMKGGAKKCYVLTLAHSVLHKDDNSQSQTKGN